MSGLLISTFTQSLTFLPLAFGISISYYLLRATDMTIDGSFVLGAAVFARLVTSGYSPLFAFIITLAMGALAGTLAATIQRHGRIDPLLAGVLATFILTSVNLIVMGRPNINLLSQPSLVSFAFNQSAAWGWIVTGFYSFLLCAVAFLLLMSKFGLLLRALGDNPILLNRLGYPLEWLRISGFAFSNTLAAAAGCLTAQTVGYADVGMGFGVTLTGIGAIILGQQFLHRLIKRRYFRVTLEFIACFLGVLLYFFALNLLLRLDVNPIYLKMMLGLVLVVFLRSAVGSTREQHQ